MKSLLGELFLIFDFRGPSSRKLQGKLQIGDCSSLGRILFIYSLCNLLTVDSLPIGLKGHCHEHNFKNSTAQKHVYTIGNLLTVVKFS